jgi:predicted metal-dependent peptidase
MDMVKQIKKQNIAIMGNKDWVWMGGVLCFGKWEVSDKVPTACTDGKNVIYNGEFLAGFSEPEQRFIILHEAMHKMARHMNIYKAIHTLDGQRANAACDYWINNELTKQDNGAGFIKLAQGGLYNPKYDGKTVIEIFKDLENKGQSDGSNCVTGEKDGKGNPTTEGYPTGGGGFDEHDWSGEGMTPEEKSTLDKDIEIAIRQGRQLAGKMSGNKPRVIDNMLEGTVDWRKELAEFMKDVMTGRDESSWAKLNRRMFHMGHFPSAISTSCGRLCIAPDMSGSIWGPILSKFMGEIKKLCVELQPSGVDIVWWDTEVCGVQSFEPSQYDSLDNLLKPVGGGGTSPQCVADWLVLNKTMNHECVVLLSDGYVDEFPNFNIPTLWAMTSSVVADSGRTIRMEEFE